MEIRFIAGFAAITTDSVRDNDFFVNALGLPLQEPESAPDSDYVSSDDIPGAKHFGVWPLSDAAQSCFGSATWPSTHPVPHATVEFEVDDVASAVKELVETGHELIHDTRTEPWGQVIARLQTADGLLIGVCFTPWLRED
ncbi:glyoxalase [Salinibacterium sp. UTAS2018]|uniref:VOC family protein n=1 Tax=Salinibacterium sp. UTAS2018 TaxID=2508880 RepID=UPI0010096381|nr:VOC family protein [Salinibacterium sp. UTAS2018]QAV70982.1 glyoxalase [Salinibacterium sp. UTAS2018]